LLATKNLICTNVEFNKKTQKSWEKRNEQKVPCLKLDQRDSGTNRRRLALSRWGKPEYVYSNLAEE